jgi:hypothetical protein
MRQQKRKNYIKISAIIFFACLILGTAFLGIAKLKETYIKPEILVADVKKDSLIQYIDTAKINLLRAVYNKIDPSRKEFLIEGTIEARNGADTTDHLENATYVFSKKGSSFYYKMGNTESINAKGLNIFIDHGIKKIMLSKQKNTISVAGIPDLNTIIDQIKGEGFELTDKKNGVVESISLKNPYHLSCKEYVISFNSESLVPERLLFRISNFQKPEDSKMDNVLDFKLKKVSQHADIEKYTSFKVVNKEKNRWQLSPEFSDYELINIL